MAEGVPSPENIASQPEKPKKEGFLTSIKNLLTGKKKNQENSTLGLTLGSTIPSPERQANETAQSSQETKPSYENTLLNQMAGAGRNNQEILEEITKMEQEIDKVARDAGKTADEIKDELAKAKLEIQAQLGVETDREAAEMLERKEIVKTILSGQYFVEREIAQNRLGGKKEYEKSEKDEKKDKIRNDLEKLLGVDNLEFDEKTGLLKRFNTKERAEKLDSKSKWYKVISTMIKLGLGVGGAAAVAFGTVTMPVWALSLVFGGTMGIAVRGITSFVRHMNLSKKDATCRLDIEKLDWQKYGEVFEAAKKIEEGSFSDAQAVINLAKQIKDMEKKSFETNESFKKENTKWKWLDVLLGTGVGMGTAIGSILAAKQEIIQEMMHQGVKFNFDNINPEHIVKFVKGKFYFLYETAKKSDIASAAYEKALKAGAKGIGKGVLRGTEFGQHGGHLLYNQELVQQAFNQEFTNKLREMIANGLMYSSVQIAELIQASVVNRSIDSKELDKELAKWDKLEKAASVASVAKKAENKPKTEEEKVIDEAKNKKEELEKTKASKVAIKSIYRFKFEKDGEEYELIAKVLEKNNQDGLIKLKFLDDYLDETARIRDFSYYDFDKYLVEKWDHEYYNPTEYDKFRKFEGVIKRIEKKMKEIKDDGKFVEIEFDATGDMTTKRNRIDLAKKYEVLDLNTKENLIVLSNKEVPGRVEINCKLTDIIGLIKTESITL